MARPDVDPALINKQYLTMKEAARLSGVARATLERWLARSWIKCTYRDPKSKWGILIETRTLLVHLYYHYAPSMSPILPSPQVTEDIDCDDDL